jgi:hypothetical protein
MSAAKALFAKLTDPAGGTYALLATRVYPLGNVPDPPTLPYVEYDVADSDFPRTYTGDSNQGNVLIDVACVGETYAAAVELARAVRNDLDNQRGTWGGVVVQGAFVDGTGEQVTSVGGIGREVQRFEADLTVRIWFLLS